MRPVEHFLLTALPLLCYTLGRYRRLPSGGAVLVVLLGTQLPDLIDKPLSWTFGVLPSGRMLAHSLVLSLPLLSIVTVVATQYGWDRTALLFDVAYLSHLAGDFYPILWLGSEYYFFPNLFWPLLAANPDRAPSFAAHAPTDVSAIIFSISIVAIAVGYVLYDIAAQGPIRR